ADTDSSSCQMEIQRNGAFSPGIFTWSLVLWRIGGIARRAATGTEIDRATEKFFLNIASSNFISRWTDLTPIVWHRPCIKRPPANRERALRYRHNDRPPNRLGKKRAASMSVSSRQTWTTDSIQTSVVTLGFSGACVNRRTAEHNSIEPRYSTPARQEMR